MEQKSHRKASHTQEMGQEKQPSFSLPVILSYKEALISFSHQAIFVAACHLLKRALRSTRSPNQYSDAVSGSRERLSAPRCYFLTMFSHIQLLFRPTHLRVFFLSSHHVLMRNNTSNELDVLRLPTFPSRDGQSGLRRTP